MTTEISSTLLADFPAVAHVIVDLPNELSDELKITGSDGHHFVRVRRLRIGEVVTAANGSGSWRPYRVVESSGRTVALAKYRPNLHWLTAQIIREATKS